MTDMFEEERVRTVTLVLQGGHLIRLGGAVDVVALTRYLEEPSGQGGVIEIASGTSERLILRRDALLGIMDGYAAPAAIQSAQDQLVSPYYRLEQFLSDEEQKTVIERIISREQEFEPSRVTTAIEGVRKSILLNDDAHIRGLFRKKIYHLMPKITQALGLPSASAPAASEFECQITAHLDGGFYHAHTDNGSSDTASRVLSYVYYFQTRPHSFFGGELKLYEPRLEDGMDVTGGDYLLIKPENNSIVFFPSQITHEVLPTYVPSQAFIDSRFTVNGWVRHTVDGPTDLVVDQGGNDASAKLPAA
jgi:Rps23 Pro-64 3,4-dihydroxylase Tpa1-like proline 4-hydroxylase